MAPPRRSDGNGSPTGATPPLAGKRILVTRPSDQADSLCFALRARGAEVLALPAFTIVPVKDDRSESVLRRLNRYQLIVFTSANAVSRFFALLHDYGGNWPSQSPPSVAVVGRATAAELGRFGLAPALVPDDYTAESMVAAMVERRWDLARGRVLWPRGRQARPVVREAMKASGAELEELVIYESVPNPAAAELYRKHTDGRRIDMVTFASPSAVTALYEALDPEQRDLLKKTPSACIGPVTARRAEELGMEVAVVAEEHTAEGLARALVSHLAGGVVGEAETRPGEEDSR